MVHAAISLHVTVPLSSCSLHVALPLQAAVEFAPTLKSQFDIPSQTASLSAPALPLHIEVSWHASDSAPSPLLSHFVPIVQFNEQSAAPQSVLQSAPATHSHAESVQLHPVPVQAIGGPPSSPHPPTTSAAITRNLCMLSRLPEEPTMLQESATDHVRHRQYTNCW